MPVVEMQKVRVLSLKKHKEQVIRLLQKIEIIDIRDIGEKEEPRAVSRGEEMRLAEIKSALAFLEGIEPKKKSFIEGFLPSKEEVTEEDIQQTCREFNCQDFLDKVKGIEAKLTNLKNLQNELRADIARLLPWRLLPARLSELNCGVRTCLIAGKIKTRNFAAFKAGIENISKACAIVTAGRDKEETYCLLIHLASERAAFSEFLAKTDLERIALPISDATPKEEIEKLKKTLAEAQEEAQELRGEAKTMLRSANRLKYQYDHALENISRIEVAKKFGRTNYTFMVEGWIKRSDLARLEMELLKVTRETAVSPIEPEKGEMPPVVLTNPKALGPFELITNIYGTPKPDEIDPTGPLSFFFALFFGICLGDFVYGLILAAFSFYFLKRYKLPAGGKKLFQLLIFGGGVAAMVGLLTGSYLGFSPSEIPSSLLLLKTALTRVQVIDPIKSPLAMLMFSLALGVVQILFGITLQMVHKIMNKNIADALLDDGLWIFFLSSLVLLIISSAASPANARLASYLSMAGGISLVLTQGRRKKTLIEKFLSGLLSLYKISGYMGDTLSYSRLLALGMSTTIIGSVINILAGMVKGGVPGLGIVLMVILLFFGHIFNLVIGTLGAFVHSTRLQMVEFFSKFYEGGGREFKPFKREAEFTIIKEV